jgi:hypothetical protein
MLSYDMGHQLLLLSLFSRLTDFLLSPVCELPFVVFRRLILCRISSEFALSLHKRKLAP